MTTIAIMQPYFIPYAGYFRLIARTDLFVAFDCVQFPRRGWVHRNKPELLAGGTDWLTLPLAKARREARINELAFAMGAKESLREEARRFKAFSGAAPGPLTRKALSPEGGVADFLVETLKLACDMMRISHRIMFSSELAVPKELKGQERIIEICRKLGAKKYLNAPGGRELYDASVFTANDLELEFLEPYGGSFASILDRLQWESPEEVGREVKNC